MFAYMNFENIESKMPKNEKEKSSFSDLINKIEQKECTSSVQETEISNSEIIKSRILNYIEKIEEKKLGDYLKIMEPEGSNGRSFAEELDFYEKARENGMDYEVTFSYPYINDIYNSDYAENIKVVSENIDIIKEELLAETNDSIKSMLLESVSVLEAKLKHILSIKDWNRVQGDIANKNNLGEDLEGLLKEKYQIEENCFEYLTRIYGDIDDSLVGRAQEANRNKLLDLETKQDKSELEKVLISNRFDAPETVWEFNNFFQKAGLDNCLAIIDDKNKNCSTVVNSSKHEGRTVVKIPPDYDVNGLRLLQLIYHESWHAITGEYQSRELGLGSLKFGSNADAAKEGLAVLGEIEVTNNILGYEKMKNKAHPYYIMAMEEIKKRTDEGKEEINPGVIYDFVLKTIREDFTDRGYDEKQVKKQAQGITRRVFRGVPGNRHYNPKDSIYFKGEEIAKTLRDAGFLKYIEQAYVDPDLIPIFLEIGIYKHSNVSDRMIGACRKVMGDIIKQENWQEKFLEDRNLWRFFASWE